MSTTEPATPAKTRTRRPRTTAGRAGLLDKAAAVTAPAPRMHAPIGPQLDREFPGVANGAIPAAPVPVFLTEDDRGLPWTFLARVAATDPGEGMAARRERVFGPLNAWLAAGRGAPVEDAAAEVSHEADETLAWVGLLPEDSAGAAGSLPAQADTAPADSTEPQQGDG